MELPHNQILRYDLANRNANWIAFIGLVRGTGMIRLAVGREVAAAHVFAVGADRARDHFTDVGVFAREFRRLLEGEAKHIVHHQDLAVAVRAGTYADGGDAQLAGDLRGEFARYGFKNDG